MDSDDALPTDVDADAERFLDDDELDADVPTTLGPHEGSEADVVDQHRVVPIDDDDE